MTQINTQQEQLINKLTDNSTITITIGFKDGGQGWLHNWYNDPNTLPVIDGLYRAINNACFDISMTITHDSTTLSSVSDYKTLIQGGDTIIWRMAAPDSHNDYPTTLESVYFYDQDNYSSIFTGQPTPSNGTIVVTAKNYSSSENTLPQLLEYRIRFSMRANGYINYFEFDPMIQTRTNPTFIQ